MDVRERAMDILAMQMGLDKTKINDEDKLVDTLAMDSLDAVELVMEIEEEFDIVLEDEVAQKVVTVGDGLKLIQTLLEA